MTSYDPVDFLKYGPIGFAGLMLCLAVSGLTIRTFDAPRERVLKLLLYVGAFCFSLSSFLVFLPQYIGAPHMLHLRIEPTGVSPPPIVSMNNASINPPLNYVISSETTAIIDMNAAVDALRLSQQQAAKQALVLNHAAQAASETISQANDLSSLVSSSGCPGGAHGIPLPNGGNIYALSNKLKNDLISIKGKIDSSLAQ